MFMEETQVLCAAEFFVGSAQSHGSVSVLNEAINFTVPSESGPVHTQSETKTVHILNLATINIYVTLWHVENVLCLEFVNFLCHYKRCC